MGSAIVLVIFGLLAVSVAVALLRDWHAMATRTYRVLIGQPLFGSTYRAMGIRGYRLFVGTFVIVIGLTTLGLAGWLAAGR